MKIVKGFLIALLSFSAVARDSSSTVYIYRLRVFEGGGRRMTLFLDEKPFAYLQNGRYLAIKLPPGEHMLSDKKPADHLKFTASPGGVVYIRSEWAQRGALPVDVNARFSVSDPETGDADVRRLKPGDVKAVRMRDLLVP